ncbi:hypothetical protein QBC37DRAFT_429896 [Rhypophila decipiens]|uniref:Uncharacterized protein n=1 Tax=Rhypophila decipiens TaxID=261697 RepID=A0AAN7B3P1_9PEZI|nr:hypothetical protein QBC37DRAFT_429896 [Rhypophila decipiens]
MDKVMLSLIPSLPVPSTEGFVLQPSKSDFGSEEAEINNLESIKKKMKRGMFNKQERGWLNAARIKDLHAMFRARQERREKVVSEENGDWAGNALNDLVETRMRIDKYGIGEHYFRESVHKLAELKGVEAPEI